MTPTHNRSVVTYAGWIVGLAVFLAAVSGLAAPGEPANLRCEYMTNPVGIDVTAPRLSWEVNDTNRGAVQSAYQILVAATPEELKEDKGGIWDSGKVQSSQSIHVAYAGPALQSRQRCYWTVRTWDAEGEPSPCAKPSFWEMGLLKPEDWEARWVTPEEPKDEKISVGSWIWNQPKAAEKMRIFFRRTFEIPAGAEVESARIRITADNKYALFINGQKMGEGVTWQSFTDFDLTTIVRPGLNVIGVRAVNEDGEAGVIFGLRVAIKGGKIIEVLSDKVCVTSKEAKGEAWQKADFDAKGWSPAAIVAKYGDEPWGEVKSASFLRSHYLRSEFRLQHPLGDVVRARVYASGIGLYELYFNGQKAGDTTFDPGWTYYPKHVMYQTYDVTSILNDGENACGLMLGNGWWGQNMAGNWRDGGMRGIAQIEIEYKQGGRQTIATDTTWMAHTSPIEMDSVYNGETYDATQEMPGWDSPGFNEDGWFPVGVWDEPMDRLVAQVGPPLRVTEDLEAKAITEPSPGVFVFDFGQNASGRGRLKVSGPRGTQIQIRYAEVLKSDGNIYTDNYRSARVTDTYTLKGEGEEVYEPHFTYRGARYAEVTGFPGTPTKENLIVRVLHSDAPWAGTFECSDDLINKIQDNIRWGQRSNMHSVPTDCPQRDERLGWTGDAQLFAPTACWNMDMAGFFTKWMRDMADSQRPDGAVTDIIPCLNGGPASPAWGDVSVVVPWNVYQFYGDTRIIETTFPAMQGWVNYMQGAANDGIFDREGYGDWVPVMESPKKPIGGAYQFWCNTLLAKMASAIGRTDDAKRCEAQAAAVADVFNKKYFNAEKNEYPGGTQTANLVPLWFGITPQDKRAAVMSNLVKDIADRGYHLSTGFIGTGYLMPTLSNNGHHDIACKLAVQRDYPSWGYMVEKGATTIWERWDGDQIEKVGAGMNSYNHFAFGSVGQWYYETLAGINPLEPGFKRILIRPRFGEGWDLDWVEASYHSMYGTIRSEWKKDPNSGEFKMDIEIPANASALVFVPGEGKPVEKDAAKFVRSEDGSAVYEVGSGKHAFEGISKP